MPPHPTPTATWWCCTRMFLSHSREARCREQRDVERKLRWGGRHDTALAPRRWKVRVCQTWDPGGCARTSKEDRWIVCHETDETQVLPMRWARTNRLKNPCLAFYGWR